MLDTHFYSRGSMNMSHRSCAFPFPSSGLGISNGERWRQLRRFTLTTLRDFGMGRKGMEAWIQEESKHLVARINTTKGLILHFTHSLYSVNSLLLHP